MAPPPSGRRLNLERLFDNQSMRNGNTWKIELGEHRWARFTYPRSPVDGLRLLGSIARGLQIGALAQTPDGRYVQVNGDHVTALSDAQVRRALRLVEAAQPREPKPPERPGRGVVVTIKRRRLVTPPTAAAPEAPSPQALRGSVAGHPPTGAERPAAVDPLAKGRTVAGPDGDR
jgi:hypothetical protein